jgi:hypothetical protein
MVNDKTLSIIESLYPDFSEYANNADFYHWMNYACELDVIIASAYDNTNEAITEYLNKRMLQVRSSSAEHDACVDVASTLEETLPETFVGVFKYE